MGAPRGNQNARKSKDFEMALRQALSNKHGTVTKALVKVATMAVAAAELGEQWAIQFIADRIDGKPAQTVEGSFTHSLVSQLTDEQLTDIATGRSEGDSAPPGGENPTPELH